MLILSAGRVGDSLHDYKIVSLLNRLGYEDHTIYKRNIDGHFYVGALINDVEVSFLVDTGATKTIISEHDALRLKIPLSRVRYTERFETPNGTISAAPIVIENMNIGRIKLSNVQASISNTGVRQSILGMNVISKLNLNLAGNRMAMGINDQSSVAKNTN